ncbi:colicin immunity domain-containing protein [Streptomyces albus]|uniref:colicin immunity domain-containing protein n=1 Tax=Streptomyces TaxID=1883 RepID=UPI000D19D655
MHKHLARILDLVFTTVDVFPPTPALAEPGDLTEDELTRRIRRLLEELDALDASSPQKDNC